MAAARLACRAWRDCLAAEVAAAALPPQLWQRPARGQLAALRRLAAAFPLLRGVELCYQGGSAGAPVDARAARRAAGGLARALPTLGALKLRGVVDAASWPALAAALAPLAPQLARLELSDACWPDHASMDALCASLTRLQRLRLHSRVFSRLTARHVDAVARLSRLRELSLGFRAADGTGAAPLALDALSKLQRLETLELEYTGLPELSNGAAFVRPASVAALSALTALSVRLVPLPDAAALARLPSLRVLRLAQTGPVDAAQAEGLGRCGALTRLEAGPLPWTLLPALARLPALRALALQLHQPARGALPPAAANALLALAPLARLTSFRLVGQGELRG